MNLMFDAGGVRCPIRCNDRAPRTLSALERCLPMPLQLHTPKIAGNHIFWHAPFVVPVEGGVDVLSARPGAFVYWPVRQFLEITFAPLQAETAAVTVLGHIEGPVETFAALGSRVRNEAGRCLVTGTLTRTDAAPVVKPIVPDVPRDIWEARLALWRDCPADISKLAGSRAIMHPVGPVIQAESEARVLHETLWWIREETGNTGDACLRVAAGIALDKAATRLRDFCHMGQTASILFRCKEAVANPSQSLAAILDEAILVAGRIGAWVDLIVPWNDLNEAFRDALERKEFAQ